jgi:CHASE3 domain sensor protein
MPNDDKRAFDGLLEDYTALDESADTVVRQLKKTPNPDNRRKIIKELRNLENKRLELLDQMDSLGKST